MSLDNDDADTITLVSTVDQYSVDVPRSYATMSTFIAEAIAQDPSASRFAFDDITEKVLNQIVEYMNHYKGAEPAIIPIPLTSSVMADVVTDPFDATFIDGIAGPNNDVSNLYALVRGALLLNMNGLLHLGCAKIGSLVLGQNISEAIDILKTK